MEITYTTSDCPLGKLLVASSARGLCMVSIGKSDLELERRLKSSFPSATILRNDHRMSAMRRSVERRIQGKDQADRARLKLNRLTMPDARCHKPTWHLAS